MAKQQRSQPDGEAWARRWRSWLRTLGLAGAPAARVSVKRLEVHPSRITATAQAAGAPPCEVEIRFTPWSDEEWQHVVDALSSQALFAAQLLAGDLPPDLERTLAEAGVELLPQSVAEIEHECSCDPDLVRPCDHLAAVYAGLGDLLIDDPWLLFRLRGRDQQGLLRGLRTQRSRSDGSTRASHLAQPQGQRNGDVGFYRAANMQDATADENGVASLESQIDQYWGSIKSLEDFRPHIMLPTVELVLLRRLGPPPLGDAGADTYEQLAALYRRISRLAYDFAYASQSEENGDERA